MLIPATITFTMSDGTIVHWRCFAADAKRPDGTTITETADMMKLLTNSPAPTSIAVIIGDNAYRIAEEDDMSNNLTDENQTN